MLKPHVCTDVSSAMQSFNIAQDGVSDLEDDLSHRVARELIPR
jgi:hypothetical protein